jgi:diguanylate cyclase (GGDEF)-like protein
LNRRFTLLLFHLFVPSGCVFLVALLLLQTRLLPVVATSTLRFFSIFVLGAAVALALRFRLYRILLAAILVLLAEQVLLGWGARSASAELARDLARSLSLLIPFNFGLLLLVDNPSFDRAAFAWWGGLVLAQAAIMSVVCRPGPSIFSWMESPAAHRFTSRMPEISIALFVIAAAVILVRWWFSDAPEDNSLFWSLWAVFAAIVNHNPGRTTAYCILTGVFLCIAVVETSYQISYQDELTKLPGRRAFNQMIAGMSGQYAVAIVDIDHFKKFNDTFGHDVGDQVLRMVASKLMDPGAGGRAFRFGGEEFVLVYPGIRAEEAIMEAERLRRIVSESSFVVRDVDRSHRERPERRSPQRKIIKFRQRTDTTVTISIGVAEPALEDSSVQEVIVAADKALYQAKEKGRNRVELYRKPKSRRERARSQGTLFT